MRRAAVGLCRLRINSFHYVPVAVACFLDGLRGTDTALFPHPNRPKLCVSVTRPDLWIEAVFYWLRLTRDRFSRDSADGAAEATPVVRTDSEDQKLLFPGG